MPISSGFQSRLPVVVVSPEDDTAGGGLGSGEGGGGTGSGAGVAVGTGISSGVGCGEGMGRIAVSFFAISTSAVSCWAGVKVDKGYLGSWAA